MSIVGSAKNFLTSWVLVGIPTNMKDAMKDRRQDIINAGLAVLREHGLSGFTQPRVAAEAGVRQSHLTYYFPTRVDLLSGVARAAIDGQLRAVDTVLGASTIHAAARVIAKVATIHENTRVIMALAQAADQEPPLRELFGELADGIILRAGKLLVNLNINPTDEHRYLLHALSVGLAVIDLATARKNGERRAERTVETALTLLRKGKEK
jgi:AcrR family transcriptional regulator